MRYSKIISLGLDCQPAHYIRTLSKQTEAYPFDWLITPMETLPRILATGPESIFYDVAQFEDLHEKRPSNATIKHKDLGIVFFHDFPPNQALGAFSQVQSKYRHLASRWHSTLNENIAVLFIRHYANKQNALDIRTALRKQYPKLAFDLLVVNEGAADRDPWGVENIFNRSVEATTTDWHGDSIGWTNIFKEFGLIR